MIGDTCQKRDEMNDEAKNDYERATPHRYTIEPLPGLSASGWRLTIAFIVVAGLVYVAAVTGG